jgi:hypothetical protein
VRPALARQIRSLPSPPRGRGVGGEGANGAERRNRPQRKQKARREADAEPCPGPKAKTPRAVQSTASTPRRAALFRAWPEVPRDGLANRLIHRRIKRQTQPTFALSHTKLEFVNKNPDRISRCRKKVEALVWRRPNTTDWPAGFSPKPPNFPSKTGWRLSPVGSLR